MPISVRLACAVLLAVGAASAAATLTISGCVDASGGHTITCNTNASGSLTPTTGITGFSVTTAGVSAAISGVTASGTTVSIALASMVMSGETVTVTLSASSNLQDGSGNTVQGQTNVATTNSSGLAGSAVNYNNAALWWLGSWSLQSTYYQSMGSTVSALDTIITGSNADVQIFGGQTYTITVDGVPRSVTVPGGVFQWNYVLSGATNTAHTVRVSGLYINRVTFRVSGTVSSPYTGNLVLASAPYTSYGVVEGGPVSSNSFGYNPVYLCSNNGCTIRFYAAASEIRIWGYQFRGSVWRVYSDGVLVSEQTISATGAWQDFTVATGLDTSQHLYEVTPVSTLDAIGNAPYYYSLILAGGTGFVSQAVPARPARVAWYGDSIIFGIGVSDLAQQNIAQVASMLTLDFVQKGNPSQKVSTYLRDNTAQILGTPNYLWLEGGVNDCILSVNAATFEADYGTMMSNAAAKVAVGGKILVRSLFATGCGSYATYNTAIQAAITAYNAGAPSIPATYYDATTWGLVAGDFGDGLHPNAAGYAKIAAAEKRILAGLIYGCTAAVGSAMRGCNTVW